MTREGTAGLTRRRGSASRRSSTNAENETRGEKGKEKKGRTRGETHLVSHPPLKPKHLRRRHLRPLDLRRRFVQFRRESRKGGVLRVGGGLRITPCIRTGMAVEGDIEEGNREGSERTWEAERFCRIEVRRSPPARARMGSRVRKSASEGTSCEIRRRSATSTVNGEWKKSHAPPSSAPKSSPDQTSPD